MNEISWQLKPFDELSTTLLYDILRMRNEVFIVEQDCPYQDLDYKDQKSYHLCGFVNDLPVAYVRIIPPGVAYEEASIGRVLTVPTFRGNGAGKLLMEEAIKRTYDLFDVTCIRIGAQLYLLKFYTALGFRQTSPTYLEDNIPHVEMMHAKNI
jgi:ElaA protein